MVKYRRDNVVCIAYFIGSFFQNQYVGVTMSSVFRKLLFAFCGVLTLVTFTNSFAFCETSETLKIGEDLDDLKSPTIDLHESFCYELAGRERRGFLGPDGKETLGVKTYAMSSASFAPEYRGDDFPRDPVAVERRSYEDKDSGLEIRYEGFAYSQYPCSEALVWFENVSDHDSANLKNVRIFDRALPVGQGARLTTGYGEDPDPRRNYLLETIDLKPGEPLTFTPREAYPSFGAFPYFVVEGSERSYLIAIGWTGQWRATVEADDSGNVRFAAGQKDVDLYLKPGEKIRTPRITLFEFPTGTDYTNLWRDWYRRYIMPREDQVVLRPKLALDVFYSGELYDKITAEEQINAIKQLRGLGYPCDCVWVDAGWYRRADSPTSDIGKWFTVGDWTPDPTRLPRGFKPVADELNNVREGEKPGKLVLWFEPERVHKTMMNDELKQYVVPDCELVESYRMNMASPKTVEYLSKTIGDALVYNGVKFYRQDSNGAGPLPFIEKLESSDPEFKDRKGYAENRYVCGLYEYWENLKKRVPGLLFDSCSSGGRRNDLEMLRLGAVPLHYSDVGYFDFVEKQHMHDTLNRWFIYYKNIDPHDYNFEKDAYDVYKTTIDVAPFTTVRPYFLTNPSAENRNYADRFLAIRELLVDGDYYSLRAGMNAKDWSVWQFDDSRPLDQDGRAISYAKDSVKRYAKDYVLTPCERQTGCVLCVRNDESEEEWIVVHPKKICSDLVYRWENLETHEAIEISGASLNKDGVKVELPKHGGAAFKYSVVQK